MTANRCCCPDALGRLLLQYAPMVRAICAQRLDCETCDDLQQEAFLRVLRTCDRVRDRRALPGYLRTITKNLCSDLLRERRLRPRTLQAEAALLDHIEEPGGDDDHRRRLEHLQDHVARLPSNLRPILEMFYFGRLDYEAIARRTGLTVGAVGQRLSRARSRLRHELAG